MKKIEKRLELSVRVKALEDAAGGLGGVDGYATTFDSLPDLDGDRVLTGAAGTASFTVPLLAFHDHKMPVGSATMSPDDIGVRAVGTYANTQSAQDMRELARAKAVPAFSIGFWSDDYEPNEFGGQDFKSIHIYEVSLVPVPANPRALVSAAKSLGGTAAVELASEKQYVDVEPPVGSFEAVQEDIRESLRDIYGGNAYVSIISTWPDRVAYAVESYPAAPLTDGTWQAVYTFDETGEVVLGAPEAIEIQQTIVSDSDDAEDALNATTTAVKDDAPDETVDETKADPEAPEVTPVEEVKAGKRNRQDDQKAINEAHDLLVKAGANCDNMIGSSAKNDEEDEDTKKSIEESKAAHPASRPNLRLLTEIAELELSAL